MMGLMSTPPTGLMMFRVGPRIGSVGLYATAHGILFPGICIATHVVFYFLCLQGHCEATVQG